MAVGAIIPVYKEPHFLNDVIRNISWVDEIAIIESEFKSQADQAEIRNAAINELDNCDYVFVLDADEILLEEDARYLLDYASRSFYEAFGALAVSYIQDFEHVVDYDTGHHAIVLVKKGVRLHDTRCYNRSFIPMSDVKLHHLKFLQPWDYIAFRDRQKEEKRLVREVTKVPLNEQLQRAVKAPIFNNIEKVGYGERF